MTTQLDNMNVNIFDFLKQFELKGDIASYIKTFNNMGYEKVSELIDDTPDYQRLVDKYFFLERDARFIVRKLKEEKYGLSKEKIKREVILISTGTAIKKALTKCHLWDKFSFQPFDEDIIIIWKRIVFGFNEKSKNSNEKTCTIFNPKHKNFIKEETNKNILDKSFWMYLQPEAKNKEAYYHERFEFIIRHILKYFTIQCGKFETDLGQKFGRKKGQTSVSDIRIDFITNTILDIEIKPFWNIKKGDKPWKTLPTSNANNAAKGILQLHDRAIEYQSNTQQDVTYGILSDCAKYYLIKLEWINNEMRIFMSQKFDLGIQGQNGNILLTEEIPKGLPILIGFLLFLSNVNLKANGIVVDKIFNNHREIKVNNNSYCLIAELGKGSSSIVYYASSKQYHKISLKLCKEQCLFKNEIRILKLLNGCKGIPKLLDYGSTNSGYFAIIMEVLGTSLDKMKPYLVSNQLKYIIMQTALILFEIHQMNIIHCDVKPNHIIISSDGIFLIDFGSSYIIGENWTMSTTLLFASSHVLNLGTPEKIDDLISLFNTFIYLKVGHLPWQNTKIDHNTLMKDYRQKHELEQPHLIEKNSQFWNILKRIKPCC